ncbi:MAG: TetR/AcrR family transcriptional regulator [Anaerolineae bacterium]
MSPRPDVSKERTKQILQAALVVFSQLGFERARMEDIAAQAGLSSATLYLYFKNKQAIVTAINQSLFTAELDGLQQVLTVPGTARERILGMVDAIAAEMEQQSATMSIVYEFFAMGLRQPAARQTLQAFLRQTQAVLEALVQEGMAQGEFRPADTAQVAAAIAAMIEGTLLLWGYDPERVQLRSQIARGVELLLDGLRPAPPSGG